MTIVVNVESKPLEQVTKQLNKLINVIKILEHEPGSAVERELMLVKVRAAGDDRARVMEIADVFRVNVVDVTHATLTLEATGKPEKLEALLSLLEDFGVVELSRTGRIALGRGDRGIRERARSRAANALAARPRIEEGPEQMATIYYEKDTDPGVLADQKIAVLGFGSQGHAHAQNLQDSGLRRAGRAPRRARRAARRPRRRGSASLDTADAVAEADVIMCLLPDTSHGEVYASDIAPEPERRRHADVRPRVLGAFRHGRAARRRRRDDDRARRGPGTSCVAPTSRGSARRRSSPCSRTRPARRSSARSPTAPASARARAGIIETTFKEETETDLFGEQTVLCGGISELVRNGFDTLVDAGYQPEIAYFECLHELKLIIDLIYEGGLSWMRYSVSDTAEWGDYQSGPRVVDAPRRARRWSRSSPRSRTARSRSGGSRRPTPASRSSSDFGSRRRRPSSSRWDGSCAR